MSDNDDIKKQMRQAAISEIPDLDILLEFKDRQALAEEIKNLRKLNEGLKARYESKEDVYYINGRKFCPVEMLDSLNLEVKKYQDRYLALYNEGYPDLKKKLKDTEKELEQQRFNNKHNLSIDQTLANKIEFLEEKLRRISELTYRYDGNFLAWKKFDEDYE